MTTPQIETIRKNIRNRIEERGTTKRKVSLTAGLCQNTVSDILSGKSKNPGIFTLAKIARVLRCSVEDLLD